MSRPAQPENLEAPRYRRELVARPEDIDELGHVSNITYVRWIQLAATEHSAALGWDTAAYRRLGAVFVVKRHEIEYRASAYADDRIELCTWVEWWRTASTMRRTEITRVTDRAVLVSSSTVWALVAFEGGRPRRIPDELRLPFSGA
jgi:acyl-CoA thioester hydrolase